MIHNDRISVSMLWDVTVITGIQSWECFLSGQIRLSISSQWSAGAAEDLNIIGPLAGRIPTAKSGISPGLQDHSPVHHYQGGEGGQVKKDTNCFTAALNGV